MPAALTAIVTCPSPGGATSYSSNKNTTRSPGRGANQSSAIPPTQCRYGEGDGVVAVVTSGSGGGVDVVVSKFGSGVDSLLGASLGESVDDVLGDVVLGLVEVPGELIDGSGEVSGELV